MLLLSRVILGNKMEGYNPFRLRDNYYYVTDQQYQASTFPVFMNGPGYFISRGAVR